MKVPATTWIAWIGISVVTTATALAWAFDKFELKESSATRFDRIECKIDAIVGQRPLTDCYPKNR